MKSWQHRDKLTCNSVNHCNAQTLKLMIEFIIKTNRLFNKAIYFEMIKILQEYNMSKSAQHPTSEGENVC